METMDEHPRGALHAYLDGELSLEGSLAVEEHLAACGRCRQELETYGALRKLLQSAKSTAPEAETALTRVTRTVRTTRRRRIFAAGGVAAMAAAAALALMLVPRTDRIVGEVAAVHARALDGGRTVELASADPSAITRWLADRLPDHSVPATGGGDGFALRGARVDSLHGRQVATVVYQVRNHLVDVFAWPSTEGDSEPRPSVAGRWTVCKWSHRGVSYWMVSDAGTEDLKALAALIKDRRA